MKKKFFIKLLCAVFASSFLIMACQPTKDDGGERRQTMRSARQMDSQQSRQDMEKMPMKKQYDDGKCCPKSECNDCCGCEWCCPKCEESTKPEGIYAPREPMKKKCPECPQDDCCGSCGCCDDCCDDCCGDCCDSCDSCDSCCDPCDSCGGDDCCGDCCDPCDSCGCNDCCCDSCGPNGRKYTRDEIFGRDTDKRYENRNDPRRYSER